MHRRGVILQADHVQGRHEQESTVGLELLLFKLANAIPEYVRGTHRASDHAQWLGADDAERLTDVAHEDEIERRVDERTAEIGRQKQYFEALVEVSPVAIATMDRDERVSGWNPAATTLFGYSPEEAIGRNIADLILRSEELRAQGEDLVNRALRDGRAHLIAPRMRKDGSLLDAEIVMVPLVIDGEHLGYYAIYHDITELEAARQEADAANQAKSSTTAVRSSNRSTSTAERARARVMLPFFAIT